jgi:hypothetical protein
MIRTTHQVDIVRKETYVGDSTSRCRPSIIFPTLSYLKGNIELDCNASKFKVGNLENARVAEELDTGEANEDRTTEAA